MIRRTPLVPYRGVWLKLENLQRTGSFKLRGAVRKLSALSPEERGGGVIAASAGNHGAGLAYAGRTLGVAVTVVVPVTTPAVKQRRMTDLGATLVVEGDGYDEAEALAIARGSRAGVPFVSPFEDDEIMAGNGGSLALEILDQASDVTRIVVPVGGGGLIAGMVRAVSDRAVSVVGVQPENNCAMYESLRDGRAHTSYEGRRTVAEGCEGAVGARCYEIAAERGVQVSLVGETSIRGAVRILYRGAGTIAECSGAVAMAGVLSGDVPTDGKTVVVVSGGNIEPDLLDEILTE